VAAGVKLGPNFRKLRKLLTHIERTVHRTETAQAVITAGGLFLADRTVRGILTGRPGGKRLRPNRPSTIAKKGSSRPLIDKGHLVRKIVVVPRKIKGQPAVFVGALASMASSDPRRSMGRVAGFAEYGTVTLLPREFLRPTLRAYIGQLRAIMLIDLGRKLGVIGPLPV
jgi:hypothetical protein